ncbi:MAG TPA: alpha/beta hydrolase-fold protein [Gemmatimonadales bacterium]
MTERRGLALVAMLLLPLSACAQPQGAGAGARAPEPLVIGETFTLDSRVLGETRRINVYLPPPYIDSPAARLPVLYMPDGGIAEDFLHVAGLVQVSVGNGTMRPFILVGIENTARRRDLTGPTARAEDRRIAPVVGGSEAFRRFLATELLPEIGRRYRVTDERAIVGESLAGLFVVETLLLEPALFDTYIAFDPSLWWNGGALVEQAGATRRGGKALFLATSSQPEIAALTRRFAAALAGAPGLRIHHVEMPDESHATVYHPAALSAFRALFPPGAAPSEQQ